MPLSGACMCVPEHALDPCHDFMGRWVGRLVEVDNSRGDVRLEFSLQWSASIWNWGEVSGANKDCKARAR